MTPSEPDTEGLIELASQGSSRATEQLLQRHRSRLRRMVALHMDSRLAARIDPSDVVQDSLAVASQRLPEYLATRPVAFYPWLRRIAWERLIDAHRRHLHTGTRSVAREEPWPGATSDASVAELSDWLMASGTSPSRHVVRQELRTRVRAALDGLSAADRQLLVMRHLEQMPVSEIAEVLEITERAAKSRIGRALLRLQQILEQTGGGEHT